MIYTKQSLNADCKNKYSVITFACSAVHQPVTPVQPAENAFSQRQPRLPPQQSYNTFGISKFQDFVNSTYWNSKRGDPSKRIADGWLKNIFKTTENSIRITNTSLTIRTYLFEANKSGQKMQVIGFVGQSSEFEKAI